MPSRHALALSAAAAAVAAAATACAPTPPPAAGAPTAAAPRPTAPGAPGQGMPAGAVRVDEDLYMVPLAERVGGCPAYVAYSLTGMVPAVIYYRTRGGGFTMSREEAACD